MASHAQSGLPHEAPPARTLFELGKQFLRLGCVGFGGPPAHLALLHQEFVQKRHWISPEQFLKGLTLAQALPGPLSTQVAIYIGYHLRRVRGALLTGGAFILPAFLLMLLLSWIYFRYGMAPAVQGIFIGVQPAVLAMIVVAGHSLSKTAASDGFLRLLAAAGMVATGLFSFNVVLLFVLGGLAGWLFYGASDGIRSTHLAALPPVALLAQLGWYFLKVGSLIFGGGMVIVPLLEQEVVNRLGWLTHREFLDGLALGQATPGPVIITATFIGYKVAGVAGALLATAAIFLPSFVFVFIGAELLERFERSRRLQEALKGINAVAVGAILGSCVPLSRGVLTGPFPVLLLVAALVAMMRYRVGFVNILAGCALLGWAAGRAGIG